MQLPVPFKRHGKWREQLDAYADGELKPRDASRLEQHLAACESCRATMEERRALKQLAAALPEMAAPRSFRITPSMLAEARGPVPAPARRTPVLLRLGQVTAGLAAVAFAAVLAADISSNAPGARQGDDDAMSTIRLAGENAGGAAAATPQAADSSLPPPEPSPSVPEFNGSTVGGASNAPTAPPSQYNNIDKSFEESPTLRDTESAEANPDAIGRAAYAPAVAQQAESGTSYIVLEAALGTLFVVALATWVIAGRRRTA